MMRRSNCKQTTKKMAKKIKRIMTYKSIVNAACLTVVSLNANAAVTLYTDEALWTAAAGSVEGLTTTATNVELANEVTTALTNTTVGSILTFDSINTGLTQNFTLETLEPGSSFTFDDEETLGNIPHFDNALSVGDIDDFEDDDWQFSLLNGGAMSAFGFQLHDNSNETGETIKLSIDGFTFTQDILSIPSSAGGSLFIGFVSDTPFAQVTFNEGSGADDIAIADFQFSTSPVPVPAAAWLFGSGLLGLVGIARRQQKHLVV